MTALPDTDKAHAAAALTPPARHLHQWVLTAFAETGHAPSRTDLERMAHDHDIDPGAALSELTGTDVLAVDEQGEIRAAYPFSPVPTRHRVTWNGGTGAYAMCAIDALGISAMLGVPVTITSTEPDTNRTVTVKVDRDAARWSPDTAVIFAAASTDTACCPSVDRTCGHINFFTTPEAAREWAARNPGVTGVVLGQAQALTCGIAEFGDLMRHKVGGTMTENMTGRTPSIGLTEFDRGWLEAIEQTPSALVIIALGGLTRIGLRPAPLDRLAHVLDRSVAETTALVRENTTARIQDGVIHWDDPYPGDRTRRTIHVGDRQIAMNSGCAPDLFAFAAVLDVPFGVEDTCATTGKPIRVDFVPNGHRRVDPSETVTLLLPVGQVQDVVGGTFTQVNTSVCTYQPFFASAEAAAPMLAAHPGSRVFTVQEMFDRSWYAYLRDSLRPLIHPASG